MCQYINNRVVALENDPIPIDVTKSFNERARVDGSESVLLRNNSNRLLHKILSMPSFGRY